MHSAARDFLYGLRLVRRNPGFSSLNIVILALGIGAAASIFSLIHAILLNPLPYRQPARLAVIWSDFSRSGGNRHAYTAPANFLDWRDRSRSFESMAVYFNTNRTFTALDRPVTPYTHEVTANFFDLLGVRALRGRTFLAGEDLPGRDRVAVISYSLWQSLFAASDAALGSLIELDGRPVQLIGVLPPGFRVPTNAITVQPDLWLPRSFDSLRFERAARSLMVLGRLRPAVSIPQAAAEMDSIALGIAREHAGAELTPGIAVQPIRQALTGEFQGTFLLLLAAVGITLLIACANVANLLLARSTGRAGEFALRSAIGASRGQLVRQLLAESLTLSLMGAALGVTLAKWSIAPLVALVPDSVGLPFAEQVDVNLPVLAFAAGLSVLVAMLFGLAPARHAFAVSLVEVLKQGGRSRTAARGAATFRNAMIVAEIAFSMTLLIAAGLMIRTFSRLSTVNPGFDASRVMTIRNSLRRGEAYATPDARRTHFANAAARLAELPGVDSVSAVSFPIPLGPLPPARFVRANQAVDPGTESAAVPIVVMPRFFETIGTPIAAGRSIGPQDTVAAAPVAVISQSLARRYFPAEDPVGQSIRIVNEFPGVWRIVGVAGDIRGAGLARESQPTVYLPHAQAPVAVMTFLMRTRGEPAAVGPAAERTLWSLGTLMNVYHLVTLRQNVEESYWQTRFSMILLGLFAAVALALATAGIYAVVSYLTAERTREIGIRIALGARPPEVLWMIVAQALRLGASGVACGLAASLAIGRILASRLYGVAATDPATLGAVALGLLIVTVAASVVPAARAARLDPLTALRSE